MLTHLPLNFFSGYLRSYLSFKYRQPQFYQEATELADLQLFAEEVSDTLMLELIERFNRNLTSTNVFADKVLLWIIKNPDKRIRPVNIIADLALDEDLVRESLDQLYKGDVINSTGWFSYEDPADPLLRQYIYHQHRDEVDNLAPDIALEDLRREMNRIRGEASRQVGHLAEIIVGGVMDRFDQRELNGADYFGLDKKVILPKMTQIDRREGVIKAGEYNEIDLIGEYPMGNDKGLC